MAHPAPLFLGSVSMAVLLGGLVAGSAEGAAPRRPAGSHHPVRERMNAYVLSQGDHTMSSDASVEEIESLRDEWSGDFLWVRRGDRKFLIRDLPTVKEARTFFAPMQALDPERHALERRQQAIQEEERDLDREEEAIEEEIQDMDDREDDDRSLPAADRDDLERRLRDVRAKMRGVEDRERALDADETALDRRSDALEAKAEAALRALIDRALEKGLARPIGD